MFFKSFSLYFFHIFIVPVCSLSLSVVFTLFLSSINANPCIFIYFVFMKKYFGICMCVCLFAYTFIPINELRECKNSKTKCYIAKYLLFVLYIHMYFIFYTQYSWTHIFKNILHIWRHYYICISKECKNNVLKICIFIFLLRKKKQQ